MITIEVSGDITLREFAASRRESLTMIEAACFRLKRAGYRLQSRTRDFIEAVSSTGQVLITITSDTPKGVRL